MTRSPRCTRRTASASCSAGISFEKITGGAGVEGAAQVSGAGERSENNDAHRNAAALQFGCNFQARQRGHFDVGDEHVGPGLLHHAQGLVAGARAGDDLDVVFHFEQCGERAQDHGLVFGEDDP